MRPERSVLRRAILSSSTFDLLFCNKVSILYNIPGDTRCRLDGESTFGVRGVDIEGVSLAGELSEGL